MAKTVKKTVRKKKRERKNIEKGQGLFLLLPFQQQNAQRGAERQGIDCGKAEGHAHDEDVVDPLWLPRAVIREQIQRRCDVLRRLACQVGVIDIPDNRRLLKDQLQFSAHKLVSKRGEAGIVFPRAHPHIDTPPEVVRDVLALLLVHHGKDGGEKLAGQFRGVDTLSLEAVPLPPGSSAPGWPSGTPWRSWQIGRRISPGSYPPGPAGSPPGAVGSRHASPLRCQ